MKKIITYGTFDMLHIGHINLLSRAKARGDYLIVGVTSDDYDRSRGKLDVVQDQDERMAVVRALEFVDEVILETHKNQKEQDVQKYHVDEFVIGDDWVGKFDYLKKYTKVIYLPRTTGISSTMLRSANVTPLRLVLFGANHDSQRFLSEMRSIVLAQCVGIVESDRHRVDEFCDVNDSETKIYSSFEQLLADGDKFDAVYITGTVKNRSGLVELLLKQRKHVLCENPLTEDEKIAKKLFVLAKNYNVLLMLAIKTAFLPAFNKFIEEIRSGIIGDILEVRSTFTSLYLERGFPKEYVENGATNLLMDYPAFVVQKIAGPYQQIVFYDQRKDHYDISNRAITVHDNGVIGIATVGIGMKSDGCTVVSGTKGYAIIPSPWWLPQEFIIRFEDAAKELRYEYDFEGNGLRYVISEFVSLIRQGRLESERLTVTDMLGINRITAEYKIKKRDR